MAVGEDVTDPILVTNDTIEEQRALVRRVISSQLFIKSARLSSLLVFICDMTLRGKADQLNEQKVGIAVFGRRPDYDAAADGIVRTHASRLRQKLDMHFSTQGAGERLRIVLPRGGYIPRFEPQAQEHLPVEPLEISFPAAVPACEVEERSPEIQQKVNSGLATHHRTWFSDRRWLLFVVTSIVIAGVALFWVMHRTHTAAQERSSADPLWGRLFSGSRPTLFVPADSGLVLFDALSNRETNLSAYIRGDYRRPSDASPSSLQTVKLSAANSRYTSVVDLEMAVGLSQFAAARAGNLDIRFARDLRPNDLKSVNAVLSGASEANPWVQLFEPQMNFVLQHDAQAHTHFVINRAPLQGEPERWQSALDDPQHRVYGVVAFVPNLTGDGDALILEGTSMSGTEAAWDFVRDEAKLSPFLQKVRKADGSVPHFELLIATNNFGASAVKISTVAWRVEK